MMEFDKIYNISEKWAIGIVAADEVVYFLDRKYQPYQITSVNYYISTILEHNGGLQIEKGKYVNKYDIEVVKIRLKQYLNGN